MINAEELRRLYEAAKDGAAVPSMELMEFLEHHVEDILALMGENARLRRVLAEYIDAEEIDDPTERLIELAVCRRSARRALENRDA